ncbi:hypothetical protein GGF31_005648 [Allomyces arbusculus]|nr:hypothetical protein GGF31_005648 [Allomyces arbusculus]
MADPITPTPPTQFADGGYARVSVPTALPGLPVTGLSLPVAPVPAAMTATGVLLAVGPPPLDRTPSKASSLEEGEIRDSAPGTSMPTVRPADPSPAGLPTTTRSLAPSSPPLAPTVPVAYAVPPPPPPAGIRATAPAFTPPSTHRIDPDRARLHHDPWARADDHHRVANVPGGTRSPGRGGARSPSRGMMKPHTEMQMAPAQWAAHEHRASYEAAHGSGRRPAPAPHEDYARQQQQQQQQQAGHRPQAPQDVAAMAQRAAWNQQQQSMHHQDMGGRGAHTVPGEHPADVHAQQQAAWYAAHGVPMPVHARHQHQQQQQQQQQHQDAPAMWGGAGYPTFPTAGAHGIDPRQQLAHAQQQQQHMHAYAAAQQQIPQHAIPVPEAMYHAHQTAAAIAGAGTVPTQDAHSAAEMQVATLALALQKAMARVHELQRENKDLKGSQAAIVSLQQQMAQLQMSIANTPPTPDSGTTPSRNATGSPTVGGAGSGMVRSGETRKSPPQTPRSATSAGRGGGGEVDTRQQPARRDMPDQETGGISGNGGGGGRARRNRRQSDKDQDTATWHDRRRSDKDQDASSGWHDRRRSDKDQDAPSGWHDRRRSDTTGDRVTRPPSSISTRGARGGGKQGDTPAPHSRATTAGRAGGKGSPTGTSPTEDRAPGGRSRAKSGGKPVKQPGERKGRAWGEPDEKAMAEAAKWMALETSSASSITAGAGGRKRTPPRSGDAGGKSKDTTPPKSKKTGKGDITSRLGPRVVADSAADLSGGKATELVRAEGPSSMEIKADKGAADAPLMAKSMVHADSGHAPEPPLATAVTTTTDH